MAGAVTEVHIKGQAELERAFMQLRREVFVELRAELKRIGEVVADEAERLAVENISQIGPKWERMRVGATVKGVYVAPFSKRSGGSPRPNLADLLMDEAMQPALDEKADMVMDQFELLVTASAAKQGFLVV